MDLGIIIIAISVLWLGSEIALARLKRSLPSDARFDKSSLNVLWITILASVNIGVLLGAQRVGYFGGGSRIFPIIGIILVAFGLLVRWLAIFSLKRQFTVDVAIRKDHRIISEGIYGLVRHPAYAGSMLSFLGLGLFFANILSIAVIFLPICLAFLHRIRVEEKALIDTFGDEYVRYCKSTRRLIPGIF
jgi:protein-S-isoprenylcysteine O-methyltransferase Ste14